MPIKMIFGNKTIPNTVMSIRYSRLKDRIIHITFTGKEGFKIFTEHMISGDIKTSLVGQHANDFIRKNFGAYGMNLLKIHSGGEFTDKEAPVVKQIFEAFSYRIKQRQKGVEIKDQYLGSPPAEGKNVFIEDDGPEETIRIDENSFTVL